MVFAAGAIASPSAVEEYFRFLQRLSRKELDELLAARGLELQAPHRSDDQLRLIAAQFAAPQNIQGMLLALSRRQLAILRQLWRNADAVAAAGIQHYFAPVLDQESLEAELSFFLDVALVLPAEQKGRLVVPEAVRSILLGRLGPAHPAAPLLRSLKRESIDMIADLHGVSGGSQNSRVAALVALLSDEARVRELIEGLTADERQTLTLAAKHGGQIDIWTLSQQLPRAVAKAPYGGYLLALQQVGKWPKDPAPSLTLQLKALLVPYPPDWASLLVIPDEVLAAMQPLPVLDPADFRLPEFVPPAPAAQPAGVQPAPVLDLVECLVSVRDERPSLTQKGLVAKPDSKRLSRRLSFQDTSYADLLFTLASVLGLIDNQGSTLRVTREVEHWLGHDELQQRGELLNAWAMLMNWHDEEDEPYPRGSSYGGDPVAQRMVTITLLAELPPAGATLASLATRLRFQIPGYFEHNSLNPIYGGSIPPPEAWVSGVLRVLGWLGLAEPLLVPGTPGSPAEVAGTRLTAFGRAVLQADEPARAAVRVPRTVRVIVQPTLDILAPPNVEPLAFYRLRAVTDPAGTGGMRTLSLTPGSVRRALDAGATPEKVRTLLAKHSEAPLPNTVESLLADVAAKHGRVRVGTAGFYLTVDDPHLLVELQSDKHTADLVKRTIGPTVALVEAASLEKILEKLRSAGHMPVVDSAKPAAKKVPALQVVPRTPPPKAPSPPRALRAGEKASDIDGILDVLEAAEQLQSPVEIEYAGRVKGRENIATRHLDVHEIYDDAVLGYDHLQDREREFKLSRIRWARLAPEAGAAEPR